VVSERQAPFDADVEVMGGSVLGLEEGVAMRNAHETAVAIAQGCQARDHPLRGRLIGNDDIDINDGFRRESRHRRAPDVFERGGEIVNVWPEAGAKI